MRRILHQIMYGQTNQIDNPRIRFWCLMFFFDSSQLKIQGLTKKSLLLPWINSSFHLFLHVSKSQYFFFNFNSNCYNLLDMRNLQEQVKKAFCYQKLFWPFTVWINCSSDLKNFANSWPSDFWLQNLPNRLKFQPQPRSPDTCRRHPIQLERHSSVFVHVQSH